MSNLHIPLEDVRVAAPCRASWEGMSGDDKVRFCQSCHKNVYNLSAMSRSEAEALIAEKEGLLCVRFYQREDGTIMTDNCPVGLKVVQRPFKWLAAGAMLLAGWGVALFTGQNPARSTPAPSWHSLSPLTSLRNSPSVRMIMNWISPPSRQVTGIMVAPSAPVVITPPNATNQPAAVPNCEPKDS